MATGATSIGIVSYTAILAHWFERKRGVASGLALSVSVLSCLFIWLAAPWKVGHARI